MAGIARWTSADLEGVADGLNIFAYAKANPIAYMYVPVAANYPHTYLAYTSA